MSQKIRGVCSSTLERLKGFTCSAEPLAKHGDAQMVEEETDGSSSNICNRARPTVNELDQQLQDLKKSEEKREDEEEDGNKEGEENSELTVKKQVMKLHVDHSQM